MDFVILYKSTGMKINDMIWSWYFKFKSPITLHVMFSASYPQDYGEDNESQTSNTNANQWISNSMITQHPLFIKDQDVTVCYEVAQIHNNHATSLYLFWGYFIQPFYLLTITFTYLWVTTMEAKLEIGILCAHILHHLIWLLSWLSGWTYASIICKMSCISLYNRKYYNLYWNT